MRIQKKRTLEAKGWKVGTAEEFLDLSPVETKLLRRKKNPVLLVTITRNLYLLFVLDHYAGRFVRDVDGYYYYDPNHSPGLWSEYHLRLIADTAKELNRPWDEELERYFKNMKE